MLRNFQWGIDVRTWGDFLKDYQAGRVSLFSETFLRRWALELWEPSDDDRKAASKLHIQLTSRITTQRLGYLEGVERTALESLYGLFQETRNICDEFSNCRHFEALAWEVLNTHLRPFTAKWHQESEQGALAALDATDDFRAQLNDLQPLIRRFDDLLLHLRDGNPPPSMELGNDRQNTIGDEMDGKLPWGIQTEYSGITNSSTRLSRAGIKPATVDEINHSENEAIRGRRRYYAIDDKPHAIGLALSGGGIRSATFSLGVLVALARRGVLPQIDYLSTVSGGGYLGSFLSAFLNSPEDKSIGLQPDQLPFLRKGGEAAALRHIRHHSKYLATGSALQQLEMICAQLFGMILNGFAIALCLTVAAVLERALRSLGLGQAPNDVTEGVLLVLGLGVVVALVGSRFPGKGQHYADVLVVLFSLPLIIVLAWNGLGQAHIWWAQHQDWSLSGKKTWLAITCAIPLLSSALSRTIEKFLLKRTGILLLVLSAIATPAFLFGMYLVIYAWGEGADIALPLLGKWTPLELEILIVIVGWLAYFFLLDINFTSPHRHYRDKLAHAYLIQPSKDGNAPEPFESAVSIRLSQLGSMWNRAPYHLLNSALNVPGSKNSSMQGRLTDFFLFSPKYCGSPLTGYYETELWEKSDSHLDLGTAMAISGGAAAPQMGLATIRSLSFWLASLNIRLGYWLRKPAPNPWLSGPPGLWCLLQEMLGTMDERLPWLDVSDGGHIENLGVYELLRRRCKYIIAIDGEHDPKMTFHGLTTLQRLAEIDLGVKLDLNLNDLRLNPHGLSRSHFRFCRIRYPKNERGSEEVFGYLLYLKLSLTGNESEFLRRYRLDQPVFPHHSTADQFFTETQFEAYRSLGEHIGDKLFLRAIVGEMADATSVNVETWFHKLGTDLLEPLSRAS
jgi:Patatin-like phospholipase